MRFSPEIIPSRLPECADTRLHRIISGAAESLAAGTAEIVGFGLPPARRASGGGRGPRTKVNRGKEAPMNHPAFFFPGRTDDATPWQLSSAASGGRGSLFKVAADGLTYPLPPDRSASPVDFNFSLRPLE